MAGTIENPQKIGIGAVQTFGLARMIDDIRLVDPSWFYTWTPELPDIAVDDWLTGNSVQLGGSDTDPHLVLDGSSDAWIIQNIPVTPGRSYDLSLVTGGSRDAAGGISVSFRDSAGNRLSDNWLPLNSTGFATLDGLAAPAGTAQARIIAWGEAGTLEVDDVSLSLTNSDTVMNGGFQSGTSMAVDHWLFGHDASLGCSGDDCHVVLEGSADGWVFQDVSVTAGASYGLSLSVKGSQNSAGGIMVDFRGTNGETISQGWMPLDVTSEAITLDSLVAPSGASKARVIAWGETGTLEIDDVSLSLEGSDMVRNGGFQAITSAGSASLASDYVPMVWGREDAAAADLKALAGELVILGFNEPDHAAQSAMSVDEAIALWPELMATGARLGSPATTTPGTLGERSWLGRFMDRAEVADLRVDFTAVHYYSANKDVGAFETFLNKTYAAYDRPIWITEWALVDWNNPGRFSSDETATFFAEAVQMLDDLSFVERHAWFGLYDGMDNWNINTHLIDGKGTLTQVGKAYADLAPDRHIPGTAQADSLTGGAGDDTLVGYSGNDTLDGGLGDDFLRGGPGANTFRLGEVDRLDMGADTISDFRPGDDDQLAFTFRGQDLRLASVAQVEALGNDLNADDDPFTGSEVDGPDLLISFGEDYGTVRLAGIAADVPVDVQPETKVVAEYGTARIDHNTLTVALENTFKNPVVLATVTTVNGAHPISARVTQATESKFDIFLDEPNHLDGWHVVEDLSWMVVEAGRWTVGDGIEIEIEIEAGTTDTNRLSSAGFTTVEFQDRFDDAPLVLTTGQSARGSDMLWTRTSDADRGGFRLWLEEEERLNGGQHTTETIGWLGISRVDGVLDGRDDEIVFRTSERGFMLDDTGGSIGFDDVFGEAPVVLAGISSRGGTDPTGLRLDDVTSTNGSAFLQEDTSLDRETHHKAEQIDWLSLEGQGFIYGEDAFAFG